MINIKNINFYLLITLISISMPSFSGNVNQGMSNESENESTLENLLQPDQNSNKKAKIKSKFKRRYTPKTEEEIKNQEEIVDVTKLNLPLTVLSMNRLVNSTLIDKATESFIEAHNLLPLLRTVQGIKKAGYRNKKLVKRLIRLTLDSTYKPKISILVNLLF